MPFHFRSRREEAASRRHRYVLAFVALALAIAILAGWLTVRYYLSGAAEPNPDSSVPPVTEPETAEASASLLILNEAGQERFVLIQFRPADRSGYLLPVPADLATPDGQTLTHVLQKQGARQAKEQVSAVLGLPIRHYITLTAADAEEYLAYLEGGVTYTLPEKVTYQNDGVAEATLQPGEQHLTATQAALLLCHSWSTPEVSYTATAQLVTAILNQYLLPEHSLGGDFAALANLMQSDIRIDHFNAYRTTLEQLADCNTDGELCRTLPIPGVRENGRFVPDIKSLQQTALYNE